MNSLEQVSHEAQGTGPALSALVKKSCTTPSQFPRCLPSCAEKAEPPAKQEQCLYSRHVNRSQFSGCQCWMTWSIPSSSSQGPCVQGTMAGPAGPFRWTFSGGHFPPVPRPALLLEIPFRHLYPPPPPPGTNRSFCWGTLAEASQ